MCPTSASLVCPRQLEDPAHALSGKVVASDFFATRNGLKSHVEKNLLSPYSNIRAITSKLYAHSTRAIFQDHYR